MKPFWGGYPGTSVLSSLLLQCQDSHTTGNGSGALEQAA